MCKDTFYYHKTQTSMHLVSQILVAAASLSKANLCIFSYCCNNVIIVFFIMSLFFFVK